MEKKSEIVSQRPPKKAIILVVGLIVLFTVILIILYIYKEKRSGVFVNDEVVILDVYSKLGKKE